MVDSVTVQRRSEIMARVKGKHTTPELSVRKMLHGAGYRYRLHAANLPGKPDLVFPARHKVVFINGWHRHRDCSLARLPKSRVEFWTEKLERNRDRDLRNVEALEALGWAVLTVWECDLRDPQGLLIRLRNFLDEPGADVQTDIGMPRPRRRA
jgi:DNA mismatch endonuclease (patch repair protein)